MFIERVSNICFHLEHGSKIRKGLVLRPRVANCAQQQFREYSSFCLTSIAYMDSVYRTSRSCSVKEWAPCKEKDTRDPKATGVSKQIYPLWVTLVTLID